MTDHESEGKETATGRFKVFHDLMRIKVERVLLISTAYEAWIMEEDCRLSEHIVHQYRGLNLSRPPRLTWVSTTAAALAALKATAFDLVLIVSSEADAAAGRRAEAVKAQAPQMPVVLLTHQESLADIVSPTGKRFAAIDRTAFWTGDAGLLLAIIKSVEDRLNAAQDTRRAGIRIILYVEDSPFYLSTLLPVLYRELVIETQAVIDEGLNEEHRLLSMRARPKILLASSYEEALAIYETYRDHILGVISDVRFPRRGCLDGRAGLDLLRRIHAERFDIPLLLASAEPHNATLAAMIPARFIDKNADALNEKVRAFLMEELGFGDFRFKQADGRVIATAADLYGFEKRLAEIPDDVFERHCRRNDVSRWLYSLAEVDLASRVRKLRSGDFESIAAHRRHLIGLIQSRRIGRQRGVIVNFKADRFDPDTEFLKIGNGSLGGKARGLAFMSAMLHREASRWSHFANMALFVPQTLVITTESFDTFMAANALRDVVRGDLPDEIVAGRFMDAAFPEALRTRLATFLSQVATPLAVRSSSLLEDAAHTPYAGLYNTYFLPNHAPERRSRLDRLTEAIKLVWASTYFRAPKTFSRRVGNRVDNEKMAVIVQRLVGRRYGDHFYPAMSGVAQSENYYPFGHLQPSDGVAAIALGLGRTVMAGERNTIFSPRCPHVLPQRSTVDDILRRAQTRFYALDMAAGECPLDADASTTLAEREVADAAGEWPVRFLTSAYLPEEHRIRDGQTAGGHPVLTFAAVLKHGAIPLAAVLGELLAFGRQELDCPVEIEFAVDLPAADTETARLAILQVRPMGAREAALNVDITPHDRHWAVCLSHKALGNTIETEVADIVYVRPDRFDPAATAAIAREVAGHNARLVRAQRRYLLIGPGRWGTADRWLGIPVRWTDISGVGAIVETTDPRLNADPSHGSHFFHNIASLGIGYLNVGIHPDDRMDWDWLAALPVIDATPNVIHARCPQPVTLLVDGRCGQAVLLPAASAGEKQ